MELEDRAHDELWRRFHRHELEDDENPDKFYQTRQMLNVAFILLVITGIAIWFSYSRDMAAYVLIGAVAFKFTELTLRILRR